MGEKRSTHKHKGATSIQQAQMAAKKNGVKLTTGQPRPDGTVNMTLVEPGTGRLLIEKRCTEAECLNAVRNLSLRGHHDTTLAQRPLRHAKHVAAAAAKRL